MKQLFYLSLVIIVLCFSCKASKPAQKVNDLLTATPLPTLGPEIITLAFQLTSKDSVFLVDTFINVGYLKPTITPPQYTYDGDIKLTWLSSDGRICLEEIIENPLLKKVEYILDMNTGKLHAEAIELEENTFFIRNQWDDCFYSIKIEKKDEEEWKMLKNWNFKKPFNP